MSKFAWDLPVLSPMDLVNESNLAKHNSLKYQLSDPHSLTYEEVLANISIGLSMIMDEIEEMKEKHEHSY